MTTMTIRTTVAFDPATAARLNRLAKRWGVSKSEAMRRSLEAADLAEVKVLSDKGIRSDLPTREQIAEMSPQQALAWLRQHPLVTSEEGVQWREKIGRTCENFSERL